jgi:peroxiredoxin
MMKTLSLASLSMLIVVGLQPLLGQTPPLTGLSNRRAPSFSLPDANFKQYDILDYRGKWLLIEFLMTRPEDCGPCKDVTAKIDALLVKHGAAKLAALAIAQTPRETDATVRGFTAATKTKVPIVFDASMVGISYFKATPQTPAMDVGHVFLVNPQGTIVKDWSGAVANTPAFPAAVDALIGGGAAKK